jgi:hypothetical protein
MSTAKVIILSVLLLFSLAMFATAADFTYKVIKAERLGEIKCMLTVRLSEKISEQQLRQLALELRAKEPKKYGRMFITYYLPGMTVGAMAWATTHFNPNLDVRILGMTAEEEAKLLKQRKATPGDVIGVWFNQQLGKVTIVKKGSTYTVESIYGDGSTGTDTVVAYKVDGRPAFKEPGDPHGEYWLIQGTGRLALYDKLGLIMTFDPVK